jgi:hypothetical protein
MHTRRAHDRTPARPVVWVYSSRRGAPVALPIAIDPRSLAGRGSDGPDFAVLGATIASLFRAVFDRPLLQAWRRAVRRAARPPALRARTWARSLASQYPFIVGRRSRLRAAWWWSTAFLVFAAVSVAAESARSASRTAPAASSPGDRALYPDRHRFLWTRLAWLDSAARRHEPICREITAVPFLW